MLIEARHLGRGGMAQVWLARRADGAYEPCLTRAALSPRGSALPPQFIPGRAPVRAPGRGSCMTPIQMFKASNTTLGLR